MLWLRTEETACNKITKVLATISLSGYLEARISYRIVLTQEASKEEVAHLLVRCIQTLWKLALKFQRTNPFKWVHLMLISLLSPVEINRRLSTTRRAQRFQLAEIIRISGIPRLRTWALSIFLGVASTPELASTPVATSILRRGTLTKTIL